MYDNNYIVYRHTAPNGKMYIGITKQNTQRRWRDGFGYQKQIRFFNAIVKYGWINFKHEILLKNLTKEEACLAEEIFIAYWHLTDREYGYNSTTGGIKYHHSEESKDLIRHKHKGRSLSEEAKYKLSKFWTGKPRPMCRKEVMQYDKDTNELINTFHSLTEASQVTGINCGNISSCCHDRAKSAGGYKWKLKNR